LNYLLVNWYRDGRDYTGWHSDMVEFHEPDSTIVVLSLGATRNLDLGPLGEPSCVTSLALADRSIVRIACEKQRVFEHFVPPPKDVHERFSLTFRWLLGT
jgi:alkylated DNA repair dioxygenase AlkB